MDLALGLRTLAVNATSGWYAPAYTEPMDSILLLATGIYAGLVRWLERAPTPADPLDPAS